MLATPIIGITLLLVVAERVFGIGVFDPARGGDPVLYQHLFWIYSHPAVYIMILPAMGAITEIIPTFAHRTIFGYRAIAYSSIAIAALGSLVWGHHMFTSGMGELANTVFSLLTFVVAVPSAIKVFNWTSTLYKGSIELKPPMLFALTFIFLFSIGGLTGIIQGALNVNTHLHDTYWIVGHFHYVMFGGTGMGFFAALLYWFPENVRQDVQREGGEPGVAADLRRLQHVLRHHAGAGNHGHAAALLHAPAAIPHRPRDCLDRRLHPGGGPDPVFRQSGDRAFPGKKAPQNPWGGVTLEWQIATPPPLENFAEIPTMDKRPYHIQPGGRPMSSVCSRAASLPIRTMKAPSSGMWLFLFTEILLFGGLFLLYSAYRAKYPLDFHNGGQHLNAVIGVVNTFILLTSSLTVAVAITALQKGNRRLTLTGLAVTILLGCAFLVNKYFEWSAEIGRGIYPNSPELLQRPDGEKLFFGLYYSMTGLHGLHVIAGVILLSVMLALVARDKIGSASCIRLENSGLYWHLVDVIWIFLLPLFYLAA